MRRALVSLLLAGCGSFAASPSAGDALTDDASVDGGGADSTPPGADGGPLFCATFTPDNGETIFCRDFDEGLPATERWNGTSDQPGTSIAIDTKTFFSPPGSFLARIDPGSGGDCGYARGMRELGRVRAFTRVAFDVRIGGEGTDPNEGASYFVFETGACLMILEANAQRGQLRVQTGGNDVKYAMLDDFPRAGTWSHVVMNLSVPLNQLDVTVDGKPALSGGSVDLAGCLTPASEMRIFVGMHCELTSASPREVRLDNIVVSGTRL